MSRGEGLFDYGGYQVFLTMQGCYPGTTQTPNLLQQMLLVYKEI
jgi:hypothetical protein